MKLKISFKVSFCFDGFHYEKAEIHSKLNWKKNKSSSVCKNSVQQQLKHIWTSVGFEFIPCNLNELHLLLRWNLTDSICLNQNSFDSHTFQSCRMESTWQWNEKYFNFSWLQIYSMQIEWIAFLLDWNLTDRICLNQNSFDSLAFQSCRMEFTQQWNEKYFNISWFQIYSMRFEKRLYLPLCWR
jgi:hypothetical protein